MKNNKETMKLVNNLFNLARISFKDNPKLANKYVKLARKSAMKVNLKLPKELKRKFCKHCYFYLVPGKNSRVRLNKNRIIYYCFNCKKYMRFNKS
jgi:ribonuclease P protein subunit RPR2